VARLAESLGKPLMPWQRDSLDLGLEMVERDGQLIPAYRSVICTVMRQSGKSILVFILAGHRCALWSTLPQRVIYTAQDGSAARKKLIEDAAPLYTGSPLFKRLVRRVYRGVGYEGIDFQTESTIRIIGSSEAAGHGMTSTGLSIIDESFADVDFRREQALNPGMATVRDAQTWNVSTAGTDQSVFLRSKIESGRALAEAGVTSGTAYIEYSIPDDADCDDPETWWQYMPALGWTITEDVVAHERSGMPDGEWRRSFGNQWTATDERVIPLAAWESCCDPGAVVAQASGLCVEVTPDRSSATIVAGSLDRTVEIVDQMPGTAWVLPRLVDLHKRYGAPVVIDLGGPAGSLSPELKAAGVSVIELTTRDVVAACAQFFDAITDGSVTVRRDVAFDLAAASVKKRQVGDAWLWSRRSEETDVCPIMAASLALASASVTKPPVDRTVYRF
jgi:hypothetical protein